MSRERIAIIGTGIAGLGAAYFLRDRYDITLYERNAYAGGHTNTVSVNEGGRRVYMDTAFMVYNETTYPNFVRLLRELNVVTQPTCMSFSVQHGPSGLEYRGTGLNYLFAQRKNMLNPRFYRLLYDIHCFGRDSAEVLRDPRFEAVTLGDYIARRQYGPDLLEWFLIPMSSAVWSTPRDRMLDFPIVTLVRFFNNHGFIGLNTQYPWRTVSGGSWQYRDKILALFPGRVRLNARAQLIRRNDHSVEVQDVQGGREFYDREVIAAHADEVLDMLDHPSPLETKLFGAFRYQRNQATLHTDTRVMPRVRRAWSAWNYRITAGPDGRERANTIYYMNRLQDVSPVRDYFISIDDPGEVDRSQVLWESEYTHPIYDRESVQAQARLPELHFAGARTYYCGSYFRYGFHEDALTAALLAARALTGERVWE